MLPVGLITTKYFLLSPTAQQIFYPPYLLLKSIYIQFYYIMS